MKKQIAIVLLLLVTTVSARTFDKPKKAIALRKGETEFTITLDSNPSTGFAWYYSPSTVDIIKLTSRKFVRTESDKIGSPGKEYWTFEVSTDRLVGPMIFNLNFAYMRAWEIEKAESAHVFVLTP